MIVYLTLFILLLPIVIVMVTFLPLLTVWIQVKSSGVPISLYQLIGMKLRNLNPNFVANHYIALCKAGINIHVNELETVALAGGNLSSITEALITANNAALSYTFQQIAALDLAGRNVSKAIKMTIMPIVLNCPESNSDLILGVAQDGIRLSIKVRVTVKANFDRLIGGASERTVIARVGEGIVAAIGAAHSHKDILQAPELITKHILNKGLDNGTAFEIISVDVAEITIVDNVGARLQEIQAEADKKVAQAKAETRRVMAIATEREMHARVVNMQSQLVLSNTIIPKSIRTQCMIGKLWRRPIPLFHGSGYRLWDIGDQ